MKVGNLLLGFMLRAIDRDDAVSMMINAIYNQMSLYFIYKNANHYTIYLDEWGLRWWRRWVLRLL